jgi:hypothetical protein
LISFCVPVDFTFFCLQSFELYLGPHSYTEDQFIRLSRLLQSVVVVRGARMTYKPRLDSLSAAKLHLDCIQWLVGKATLPEPEPPLMNQLGCMFRGLALLLIGIDGRSCLKMCVSLLFFSVVCGSISIFQVTTIDSGS